MVIPGWLPILLAELLPNFLPERLPRILSELLSVMCPKHSGASNRHPEFPHPYAGLAYSSGRIRFRESIGSIFCPYQAIRDASLFIGLRSMLAFPVADAFGQDHKAGSSKTGSPRQSPHDPERKREDGKVGGEKIRVVVAC